jgi:rfaE bifunctional protein nucleotidyltransferase chain/domain
MDRVSYVNNKIVDRETAERRINYWRLKGHKVVFTNGCFDILHRGHVSYLAQASSLGNKMVLAINTDDSVRRLGKGADRPINDEVSRAIVTAGLGFIDLVVSFNEDTPLELIKMLKPDVLVKGGDYNAEQLDSNAPDYIVGSDVVRKDGGTVATIPLVDGFSTTSIVEKLKKA